MLDEFAFGRKDAETLAECGTLKSIPRGSKYVDGMVAKGFTPSEVVALAAIEAFGVVQDPSQARWSTFPKFDTYYYKQLLSGDDVPLKDALLATPELREEVEKFAQSKGEWDATFRTAFSKLCDLGHSGDELTDVEYFLNDEPGFKLRFPHVNL